MGIGKNEQVSEYVVKSEPCGRAPRSCPPDWMLRCSTCLGSGERLVVSTAIPVELVDVTCDWDGTLEVATYQDPHPEPGDYYRICAPVDPEGDQT